MTGRPSCGTRGRRVGPAGNPGGVFEGGSLKSLSPPLHPPLPLSPLLTRAGRSPSGSGSGGSPEGGGRAAVNCADPPHSCRWRGISSTTRGSSTTAGMEHASAVMATAPGNVGGRFNGSPMCSTSDLFPLKSKSCWWRAGGSPRGIRRGGPFGPVVDCLPADQQVRDPLLVAQIENPRELFEAVLWPHRHVDMTPAAFLRLMIRHLEPSPTREARCC